MNRHKTTIAALAFCFLMAMHTQAISDAHASAPTITVTKLDVKEEALNLAYEIRNDSENDAWIFVGGIQPSCNTFGMGASVYMDEDSHTLTINAAFNSASTLETVTPIYSRFVRLLPGQSQAESIFMKIPVHVSRVFGRSRQHENGLEYAMNLAVELGYYRGNLPERILKSLKPPENILPKEAANRPMHRDTFIRWNEFSISRDDELLIRPFREFEDENQYVLKTVVENVRIPYEEKPYPNHAPKIAPPDLASCTKVEIRYQPSILEYFFPFSFQQSLLTPDELQYLQSEKTFVGAGQDISFLANDISRGSTGVGGVVVRYRTHVDVVCDYESKPPLSFPICNDDVILIEGEQLICLEGFPSLKMLTPQIEAIDLRSRCAGNLRNQWYRMRFYNLHEALRQDDPSIRDRILYPTPTNWCDNMLRPYPLMGSTTSGGWGDKPHFCPGAGEGKNHYAMNPNCKPDSPSDMVLLFETKDGWNQHGGPELFTFDNHDPKGGCILLNDGTVKFIRTAAELRLLRWE